MFSFVLILFSIISFELAMKCIKFHRKLWILVSLKKLEGLAVLGLPSQPAESVCSQGAVGPLSSFSHPRSRFSDQHLSSFIGRGFQETPLVAGEERHGGKGPTRDSGCQ